MSCFHAGQRNHFFQNRGPSSRGRLADLPVTDIEGAHVRGKPAWEQQELIHTSRNALPLPSNQFPIPPTAGIRHSLHLPPAPISPRSFLCPGAPCVQNRAHMESIFATRSKPFCCCCSPLRSAEVQPPREPHPAPASRLHECRTAFPLP